MRVSFAPAFLKQLEKLDPGVKEDVKAAAAKIIDFYTEGKRTPGLGIKRLRREIWEARAGLRVRVLYLLAGNPYSPPSFFFSAFLRNPPTLGFSDFPSEASSFEVESSDASSRCLPLRGMPIIAPIID